MGKNGPIDVANRIINSYYNGKMVMYEFQPAVAAYYDGACYAPKQLIRAWEPWSGHFVLDIGFWLAMHFSRFARKGWMYVNGACYGDGEENHAIANTTHNFMTLTAPDRSEMSMFFTNESEDVRIYTVQVKDMSGEEEKNSENGKDSAEMIQEMRYNEVVCYEKLADWENAKQKASEYLIEYPEDTAMEREAEFLETR